MTHKRCSLRDFSPGEAIKINSNSYTFVVRSAERSHKILLEHGKQAIVAKVQRQDGVYCALKSFKDNFQSPVIKERAMFAAGFADIPGMQAAQVEVIVPDSPEYAHAVSQYPFLEYAVIMTWLPGRTWSALRYLYKNQKLPVPDYSVCQRQALSLATLLNELHSHSVTHCDICPRNVFMNADSEVALIDFENMFSSSLKPPPWGYPAGQDGYRHHSVPARSDKQWGPHGDLFAGALLIAELIAWYDPEVREQSNDETFIEQERLHVTDSDPYLVLLDSLKRISKGCATLFSQAWKSKTLEDCPSMDAWVIEIANAPGTLEVPKIPIVNATKCVKKPRKEDRSRAPQPQSTLPISRTHQPQTHTCKHVAGRKAVSYKGDRRRIPSSIVSKHITRRVPPSEIRSRREKLSEYIRLDTKGLLAQAEDTLNEIFPQAEIVHGKGGSGSTCLKFVAIMAGFGVLLLCILPVLVSLVGQLFAN